MERVRYPGNTKEMVLAHHNAVMLALAHWETRALRAVLKDVCGTPEKDKDVTVENTLVFVDVVCQTLYQS